MRLLAHTLNRQLCTGNNLLRLIVKRIACDRQRHRVFPSHKKRHGKLFLQILHLPAERRLREVQSLRGAIEGSMLRDGYEVTKMAKFHLQSLAHTKSMSKAKNTALEGAPPVQVLFASMNTNTTLPEAVTRYFEASNRFDAESAAACFTPEAIVRDEAKTYIGTEQIRNWVSHASTEYQPQASVVGARQKEDKLVVTVNVTGQFPQSPIDLDFEFSIRDEKIAELSVS